MSYTKTTWVDGDLITAQKMNKIEDGIVATNKKIFDLRNVDSLEIGYGYTAADFIGAVILYYGGVTDDFKQIVGTVSNLNTVTFRCINDSNDHFYFYYDFLDGCIHIHRNNQ